MTTHWQDQQERAGSFWLAILVWIARNLGRRALLLSLYPVTFFYVLVARSAVSASQRYLMQVLGRPVTWRDSWKHFYYFAVVSVDRLYLLANDTDALSVSMQGQEALAEYVDQGRGCMIFVSHHGSFEALRVSGLAMQDLPLKIVMDHGHNAAVMQTIDAVNPEFAQTIIDSRQLQGPALALRLAEELEAGTVIGMMVDRSQKHEAQVPVRLLGRKAYLPAGPWLLASALGVPVFMCFGLYEGANRYSIYVEQLDTQLKIPRRDREQSMAAYAQRYADRMEHYIKKAPFNWFNFYDFWV